MLDKFPQRVNPCKSDWFFDAKGSETLNNLLSKYGSCKLLLPGAKLKYIFSRIKIREKKKQNNQPPKPPPQPKKPNPKLKPNTKHFLICFHIWQVLWNCYSRGYTGTSMFVWEDKRLALFIKNQRANEEKSQEQYATYKHRAIN